MLSARDLRTRAADLGIRPTKQWGQNFVIDPNTVDRIARLAEVGEDDVVVEIGPGLGSLTLALLTRVRQVIAVEVDPTLASALPETIAQVAPAYAERLVTVHADALQVFDLPGEQPTALVANLPYNVSVPVVLRFLELFPSIRTILVMVQLEVAQRLAAAPGSKIYGVPSLKAAWYADVRLVGTVPRTVFWPVPNVDSGLVRLERRDPPRDDVDRKDVFAAVDAAFAQRRKTLRSSLASWAGSPAAAEEALRAAGIDPRQRGEQLTIGDFAAVVAAHRA
ncbi:MAG: 16S rRNA (adenine(1518)-N(6)/adenine(1519)-N(6))-dimethyltransferase RsmA [Actinomycetales bacterium]|nr:16S rRNA (adenine(1518)-N(6)/adenine(1519)-N(6))-dimethyltransferase RsmA [Dietzia sp.]NLW98957.1 16S rRNA (adenine(1518)-N(6)/adenine(1519)-N(6))-dimethyltransferase RsmA [Actinomycetales bacterium]